MSRKSATRAGPIRARRAGHRDRVALALPGAWVRYAACGPDTAELFFPISDTGPAARDAAKAKALCASCPVQAECRADAETTGQPHGIWGGLTPTERHPQPHQEAAA